MQIEIRLKQLLREFRMDKYGVLQEIADDCDVHRHTIGKLYRNQMSHPSLEVLGKVCGWLVNHGMPEDILPQALFGSRPELFWQAIAAPGKVCMYVGEYRNRIEGGIIRRWVASSDAAVLAGIAQHLSSRIQMGDIRPSVRTKYVPFAFSPKPGEDQFEEERARAKATFDAIQSNQTPETAILIGSQRANYLAEFCVADLFGCRAFEPPKPNSAPKVPFYTRFRKGDRLVDSCFGGYASPPGLTGKSKPGLYYIDESGKWHVGEWVDEKKDAGMVITVYDAASSALTVAAFGFSGRSTASIGVEMLSRADDFWPPVIDVNGRQIGVYVCRFEFKEPDPHEQDMEVAIGKFEVVKMDEDVLAEYLKAK